MSEIAVGDIHGNLDALQDLLSRLLPQINSDDTLIFLRDYVDRGPDTKGCIRRLLELKAEPPCRLVFLRGNHEDWMLKTFDNYQAHSWICGMEAFDTISSYSNEAAEVLREEMAAASFRLFTEKVSLPYQVFFDAVPPAHLNFLLELEYFHETAKAIFVHGGLESEAGALSEQDPHGFMWGKRDFYQNYQGEKTVVYGHWHNALVDNSGWPQPRETVNTVGIDTIDDGVLTAIFLPSREIVQSRRYL